MHVSEFDALWREYVAAFGELLRPAECNAQSPAAKRLVRCVEDGLTLVTALMTAVHVVVISRHHCKPSGPQMSVASHLTSYP